MQKEASKLPSPFSLETLDEISFNLIQLLVDLKQPPTLIFGTKDHGNGNVFSDVPIKNEYIDIPKEEIKILLRKRKSRKDETKIIYDVIIVSGMMRVANEFNEGINQICAEIVTTLDTTQLPAKDGYRQNTQPFSKTMRQYREHFTGVSS